VGNYGYYILYYHQEMIFLAVKINKTPGGNMKRKTVWVTLICIVITAITLISGCGGGSKPPSITSVQKMGHLVALKINVSDVIEFTQKNGLGIPWTAWNVPLGGTKVLYVLRGDCLLSTDLRAAAYAEKDASKRTATIVLPEPTVTSPRVNHDKDGSYFYSVSSLGISKLPFGDDNRKIAENAAMQLAQKKVEEAGKSPEALQDAKDNAEKVLKGMFSALDWDLNVKWKK
jgi:hypothetical protein